MLKSQGGAEWGMGMLWASLSAGAGNLTGEGDEYPRVPSSSSPVHHPNCPLPWLQWSSCHP